MTALTASEYLFEKDYEKNEARKKIPKELDTMNIKAAQQGGIIRTIWPGRLEVLKKEPLFYRDGAHKKSLPYLEFFIFAKTFYK